MRYLMIILTLLGLAACSEPAEPPAPQVYDPDADVIGAPLHEALDKAGGVEARFTALQARFSTNC